MSIFVFDGTIAKEIGINEAIIFQNILYWLEKNAANKKNIIDGEVWTYNSTTAFCEIFPFFTQRQIHYALQKLVDKKLLKVANHNPAKYDRTLWYALDIIGKSILQNCKMEVTKLLNASNEIVKPIPNINTDINTDINTSSNNTNRELVKKEEEGIKNSSLGFYSSVYAILDKIPGYVKSQGDKEKIDILLKISPNHDFVIECLNYWRLELGDEGLKKSNNQWSRMKRWHTAYLKNWEKTKGAEYKSAQQTQNEIAAQSVFDEKNPLNDIDSARIEVSRAWNFRHVPAVKIRLKKIFDVHPTLSSEFVEDSKCG